MQFKFVRINNAIITLFALSLLSMPGHVSAQEHDSIIVSTIQSAAPVKTSIEFFLGAGTESTDELFNGWHGGNIFGVTDYKVQKNSGAFSGGIKFFFNKVAFNIAFANEQESGIWQATNYTDKRENWSTQQLGTFYRQAFTIAPEITFIYHEESEGVGLTYRSYGSVGFGITYVKETDVITQAGSSNLEYANPPIPQNTSVYNGMKIKNDGTHYNIQVTPIGFEVGGKLKWFLEVGIGYKGLINTGLTWKVR